MCLSTVYKNKIDDSSILMKNVVSIQSNDTYLIFTDLMERTFKVKGQIKIANLVDGYVVINVDENK